MSKSKIDFAALEAYYETFSQLVSRPDFVWTNGNIFIHGREWLVPSWPFEERDNYPGYFELDDDGDFDRNPDFRPDEVVYIKEAYIRKYGDGSEAFISKVDPVELEELLNDEGFVWTDGTSFITGWEGCECLICYWPPPYRNDHTPFPLWWDDPESWSDFHPEDIKRIKEAYIRKFGAPPPATKI